MSGINYGQFSEALNDKMDRDAHNVQSPSAVVVAKQDPTAENNLSWYRKYSDGWVEQGGFSNTNTGNVNITLLIEMADSRYSPRITQTYGPAGVDIRTRYVQSCSTTMLYTSSASGIGFYWEVKGYAANQNN